MAAAVLRIGRLPGVDRPALAVQVIRNGTPIVLLDIGANPDSTPENLLQYARMGTIFAERVIGVEAPRVALLSIGEEKGKGDHKAADRYEQGGLAVLRVYMHRNMRAGADSPDTVFWDPLLPAADGTATLRFDLSGNPATYRVVLYGHDAAGRLGVYLGKLEAGK